MVAAAALEELVLTADGVAVVPEEPVAVGALALLEELLDGAAATNVSGLRWPQLFFSSELHFA
jgi:hypothetical protein